MVEAPPLAAVCARTPLPGILAAGQLTPAHFGDAAALGSKFLIQPVER